MLSLCLPGAIPADTCRHLHLNARVSGIIQVYIYIFFLSFFFVVVAYCGVFSLSAISHMGLSRL